MTAPGEIVTKRDEIARELAKERERLHAEARIFAERFFTDEYLQGIYGPMALFAEKQLADARTRLAEREAEIQRIVVEMEHRFCTVCTANEGGPHNKGCPVGELRALLDDPAPRKEPR